MHHQHYYYKHIDQKKDIEILKYVILLSWKKDTIPIVYISSSRNKVFDRSHSDYIDYRTYNEILKYDYQRDIIFDVEAKHKEKAIFELQNVLGFKQISKNS